MLISKEDTLKLIRDSVNLDEAYIAVKNMDPAMENEYMMHHINGMCLFRADGKRCRFPAVDVRYIDHFGVNEDEVLMFSTSGAADWYGEIGVQLTDEVKNFFRAMFHKKDEEEDEIKYLNRFLVRYLDEYIDKDLTAQEIKDIWVTISALYPKSHIKEVIHTNHIKKRDCITLINVFTKSLGYKVIDNGFGEAYTMSKMVSFAK